ncbi:MAG: trigger factor [Chlorobium sp.]|nr:MAG: trigger factor [Chlorobium sp.]
MQKIISNSNETEQILEITLTAEEFGAEYNQELEEARRSIQIKGFRKGHAPVSLIKKLAGHSIEATVADKMASKYFTQIVEADNIKPVNRAEIVSFSFEGDQLAVKLVYEVQPEFELNDISGYSFTKTIYTITEEDVDREVKHILKGHGSLISVDEAASATDTVIGDVWKLNEAGEPDETQKTSNHHFSLEYLPEANPFRKELTGKKAGENVDIENKEPDSETEPSRYRVAVSEVKRLDLPELTEDLVKEITDQQFESIADFKADIQAQLQKHFTKKAEDDLLESISAKLIEDNPVPTPESIVESFSNMLLENAKRQIGGNFPKNFNSADFRETLRPNAIKHAQWMIITRKIAETANISVSDDDLKSYMEKEAMNHPEAQREQFVESYKNPEISDYIAEMIFKGKIYDHLKSQVTIIEEAKPVPAPNMEE